MKRLKHKANACRPDSRPPIFVKICQICAIQPDFARCWQVQASKKREKR